MKQQGTKLYRPSTGEEGHWDRGNGWGPLCAFCSSYKMPLPARFISTFGAKLIWAPAVLCYSRTSGRHRAWTGNQKLQGVVYTLCLVSGFVTEVFCQRKIFHATGWKRRRLYFYSGQSTQCWFETFTVGHGNISILYRYRDMRLYIVLYHGLGECSILIGWRV